MFRVCQARKVSSCICVRGIEFPFLRFVDWILEMWIQSGIFSLYSYLTIVLMTKKCMYDNCNQIGPITHLAMSNKILLFNVLYH